MLLFKKSAVVLINIIDRQIALNDKFNLSQKINSIAVAIINILSKDKTTDKIAINE